MSHSYVIVAVRVPGDPEEALGMGGGSGILDWLGAAFPEGDVFLLNTIPAPKKEGDHA